MLIPIPTQQKQPGKSRSGKEVVKEMPKGKVGLGQRLGEGQGRESLLNLRGSKPQGLSASIKHLFDQPPSCFLPKLLPTRALLWKLTNSRKVEK